jgi:hypothetical protein
VLVRETRNGQFQQEIAVGKHRFLADEPVQAGAGIPARVLTICCLRRSAPARR